MFLNWHRIALSMYYSFKDKSILCLWGSFMVSGVLEDRKYQQTLEFKITGGLGLSLFWSMLCIPPVVSTFQKCACKSVVLELKYTWMRFHGPSKKRESNQHGWTEIKPHLFGVHTKILYQDFSGPVLVLSGARNQDFVKLNVYTHISVKVPSLTFGGQRTCV